MERHRPSCLIHRLLASCLALAVLLGIATAPGAAFAQGTLVADPATVTLTPGGSDRLVVRLQNAGSGSAKLAVDGPPSVNASVVPVGAGRGSAREWIVTLSADTTFQEEGTAILKAELPGRVVTGTIALKLRQAPDASSQLGVELAFEGETLLDGLPRPLLARVTNLSAWPLMVRLEPHLPPFISAVAGEWQRQREVPPRSTIVVPIPIEAGGKPGHALLSGKHEVAVVVSAWRVAQPRWSAQAVANATLSVGVPGMAEVQGLLQIPSFLFLPGFLLVTACALTLRFGRRYMSGAQGAAGLAVDWSSGLWLVAITLSMVMVPLYSLLSWITGAGWRNILYGFDLGDVIRVWTWSLAVGFGGALIRLGGEALAAKRKAQSAFAEGHSPLELLDRLHRLERSAVLPFVTLVETGDPRLYRLEELPEGVAWACSAIACRVVDRGVHGFDPLKHAEVLRSDDPASLRDWLGSMSQAGAIVIGWQQSERLTGVGKVASNTFANLEKPRSVVVQG